MSESLALTLALLCSACSRSHLDAPSDAQVHDAELATQTDATVAQADPAFDAGIDPLADANHDSDAAAAREAASPTPVEPPSTREVRPIERWGEYLELVEVRAEDLDVYFVAGGACGRVPQDAHTSLHVTVRHEPCDLLGPITADVNNPSAPKVSAWLWRAQPSCDQPEGRRSSQLNLRVALAGVASGAYQVSVHPESVAILTVLPKAETCAPTTLNSDCQHDCECRAGERCTFEWGADFVCAGWCRPRCNNAVGCSPTASASSCGPLDPPCPTGMVCRDQRCRWDARLDAAARHSCVNHTDCTQGLLCVRDRAGRRSCEVPCNDSNMLCPGMHFCQRHASYTGAEWVCEWGGE